MSGRAAAGGIDEMPDQGAEALGRGATFTAKADDATALYYNVAGLARQRGTKLQITANNHFNTMTFQRAGEYADDSTDPLTPWGGRKYPLVEDKNKSFTLPMLVASSDFGVFDRLTFGLGVFGPAATGRTFQLGVNGLPSPSRYDAVQSKSLLLFPTLGAAYRVTDQLDIGVSAFLAVADVNQMAIAYADSGGGACKNPEYRPCDAEGRFTGKGTSAGAALGAMFRVNEAIQLGLQVRSPVSININGSTTAKIGASKEFGEPTTAGTTLDLPWVVRLGGRYVTMEKTEAEKRELWDVELNLTYETWGSAQDPGPQVKTADPLGTGDVTTIQSLHKWNDTFGVRVGGAYNYALDARDDAAAENILVFRAGAFFDSSATEPKYTRLDSNTLPKIAGTAGLGFKHGPWSINLAYAAVASLPRTVTDGELRPNNGAKGGDNVDGDGNLLPPVNNGDYAAFSHVLAIGVEVNFERFFRDRKPTFGDPEYENLAGDVRAPKPKEKETTNEDEDADADSPPPVKAKPKPKSKEEVEPPGTWWKPRVSDEQLKPYQEEDDEEEEPPPKPAPRRPRR
ncbi:MAG: outer membrane protein transport protein [Labilithrix sp.]|nr:outer membrane protein transport protein [Labilithrix sp.]MCW5813874.1 outer membrane protein transport protein [Labilithrix sp.]